MTRGSPLQQPRPVGLHRTMQNPKTLPQPLHGLISLPYLPHMLIGVVCNHTCYLRPQGGELLVGPLEGLQHIVVQPLDMLPRPLCLCTHVLQVLVRGEHLVVVELHHLDFPREAFNNGLKVEGEGVFQGLQLVGGLDGCRWLGG